jgi:RNA polymerase sigma factor (TIGR02999 family)
MNAADDNQDDRPVDPGDFTRELRAAASGNRQAGERLLPMVYGELRALARARMRCERKDHTLQATELVHEAYLRLAGGTPVEWEGRGHVFAAAAEAMRRILIEHARARSRVKRGGDEQGRPAKKLPLTLAGIADLAADADPEEILALDDAMERLEARDARMGQVVRLRFYAGLSIEETAAALGVAPRTAKRDWTFARAWLYRELAGEGT